MEKASEKKCPTIVSCVDILALTARDAIRKVILFALVKIAHQIRETGDR